MKNAYPIQIRFRDLDPLSHVNNSVFFVYYEEARDKYFEQLSHWLEHWPGQEEDQGIPLVAEESTHTTRINTTALSAHYGFLVKQNECTYNLPMVHTDEAEIDVRVINIGRTSITMTLEVHEISDPTRIYATGRSVLVWCNYHTGRPSPVPPAMRSAIESTEERTF